MVMGGGANAEEASGHPSIGVINARELRNADVLALPERERDAWIHGAVVMMVQTSASQSGDIARCVMDWYFELPNTHDAVLANMDRFKDSRASATMFGLANQSCEGLME